MKSSVAKGVEVCLKGISLAYIVSRNVRLQTAYWSYFCSAGGWHLRQLQNHLYAPCMVHSNYEELMYRILHKSEFDNAQVWTNPYCR